MMALIIAAGMRGALAPPAHAQVPPARFFGSITFDGVPAPAGTEIRAYVGDAECGVVITRDEGRYVLDVKSQGEEVPNCGADGLTVAFIVAGRQAAQIGEFQIGYFINLDLAFEGDAPPPSDQPPSDQPPAEEPPADQPPEAPPAEEPPPDQPPAEEPPAE
jgi:hypothetical protein